MSLRIAVASFTSGARDVTERLKGPPFAQFFLGQSAPSRVGRARIGSTAPDPFGQQSNFRIWQFSAAVAGRHLRTVVIVSNRSNQEALVDVAGDDHGAGFAPIFPAQLRIESQVAMRLPFGGRMARFTALNQDRTDTLLEKLGVVVGNDPTNGDAAERASTIHISSCRSRRDAIISTVFLGTVHQQPLAPRLQVLMRGLGGTDSISRGDDLQTLAMCCNASCLSCSPPFQRAGVAAKR